MGTRRVLVTLGLLAVLNLAAPGEGTAHPLGNFSISRYTGIEIGRETITLRYFVDMAEIPTFQELQAHGIPPIRPSRAYPATSGTPPRRWGMTWSWRSVGDGCRSTCDPPTSSSRPEPVSLPTMKLAILYRAALGDSRRTAVEDAAVPRRELRRPRRLEGSDRRRRVPAPPSSKARYRRRIAVAS